jgi:hypothetical protein
MIARETFESRIETIETRMDARVASIANKVDHYIAVWAERDASRALLDQKREESRAQLDREREESRAQLDREREESRALLDQERERRLVERDKRIEILAASAERSAQKAEGLKSTIWLAAIAIIVASVGSSVSSFYAIQSSNLALVQATLSIFQQGQNTPFKQ